jgi:hypothetical protein
MLLMHLSPQMIIDPVELLSFKLFPFFGKIILE